MMDSRDTCERLRHALLNDEYGISEYAYFRLVELVACVEGFDVAADMGYDIDAVDGRFSYREGV